MSDACVCGLCVRQTTSRDWTESGLRCHGWVLRALNARPHRQTTSTHITAGQAPVDSDKSSETRYTYLLNLVPLLQQLLALLEELLPLMLCVDTLSGK